VIPFVGARCIFFSLNTNEKMLTLDGDGAVTLFVCVCVCVCVCVDLLESRERKRRTEEKETRKFIRKQCETQVKIIDEYKTIRLNYIL
jgi:hypothetical protein